MSEFANLLSELEGLHAEQETMIKALPADDGKDDEKIQAAAEDGGDMEDEDEDGDEDDGEACDDKPMAKSFEVTLEDGTKAVAQDGTELVKSLMEKIDTSEATMAKAMGAAVNLIKSQGEMIKSLTERMNKLASEGRGRKAVVTITEKKPAEETLKKSEGADGMTPQEFMLKSEAAFKAGKISGLEYTTIDVSLRTPNASVPSALIAKVLS